MAQHGLTHGHTSNGSPTKFYKKWQSIKQRCDYPKNSSYDRYGAKGITYCKRWKIFENFLDDMYESYLEHRNKHGERQTTIDRIDSTSNYCKENCRFATYKEQNNNKKKMVWTKYRGKKLEFKGLKKTITQWANILGVKRSKLAQRYYVYHWTPEKTLSYNL